MPYVPIALSADVPDSIRQFVLERVEPYLRDVRLMLEYPKRDGDPGFNLTAAAVLCSVIGGLARVFFNATAGDGVSFKQVAGRYPLDDEPLEAITGDAFAEALYVVFRCNLIHSLGLNMERDSSTKRYAVELLPTRTLIVRHGPLPASEEFLRQLDESNHRARELRPTLACDNGAIKLVVDSLYAGVRRLVKTLAEDTELRAGAMSVLAPWYRTRGVHTVAVPDLSSSPAVYMTVTRPGLAQET